jgi:hypothetical protein
VGARRLRSGSAALPRAADLAGIGLVSGSSRCCSASICASLKAPSSHAESSSSSSATQTNLPPTRRRCTMNGAPGPHVPFDLATEGHRYRSH